MAETPTSSADLWESMAYLDEGLRRDREAGLPWDVMERTVRTFAVEQYVYGNIETFAEVEQGLAEMGSSAYLVGVVPRDEVKVTYPQRMLDLADHTRDRQGATFALHAGYDRRASFEADLREQGITLGENLARLAIAGSELWTPRDPIWHRIV